MCKAAYNIIHNIRLANLGTRFYNNLFNAVLGEAVHYIPLVWCPVGSPSSRLRSTLSR